MRRILLSRFVLVPLLIGIAVGLWNIYVTLHAHGIITGQVVDASGHPVPGATVILYERDFINQIEKGRTKTDAEGDFRLTGNRSHLVQLQAVEGSAQSPRVTLRLWFRAQDRKLDQPLRLTGAA